jgi:hypothetical protein
MASKASLIAKAFGGGGAFSPIADKTLSASDRKLTSDAMGAGASGQQVVANINALIALSGMNSGDTVLVSSNNKLYLWNGSGWYIIATVVNDAPSAITGVDGSYALATDGTATTVTAVSTDPEGLALTWSYVVQSGSLGSTATVSQADNVFTITPSTNSAHAGTFTLRFSATDGINGAVIKDSIFELSFTVLNSRYTSLSVKAANTGSNIAFDDASSSNNTITKNGTVIANTFSPYRHGGYATYFDGNDRIDISTGFLGSHTEANASTSTFTIESWVYQEARGSNNGIDGNAASIISKWVYFNFGIDDSGHLHGHHYSGAGQHNLETTATVALKTWTHVAMVVTGAQIKLYINGTLGATGTWYGMQAGTSLAGIGGSNQSHPEKFTGYMHDIRVSDNARYTTNFTPADALTTDSNTDLLIGKLQVRDLSSNSVALTLQGDVKVVPFNTSTGDNAPYSEADHGKSAKIESSGSNRLTSPITAMGTGDFTVSGWVYTTGSNNPDIIFDTRPIAADASTGFYFAQYNAGYFYIGTASNDFGPIQGTTNYPKNAWNHFAIVRDSSGNLKMYINGNLEGTDAIGTSKDLTSTDITIGSNRAGSSTCNAYVSDLKIESTAVYTAAFTPSTTPAVSDSNTTFLFNPETSISDLSQKSEIQCFGDAATSTTQVKFAGTKSIAFDGTEDYLRISASNDFDVSLSDITIEGWFYTTSTSVKQCLWEFYSDDNNYVRLFFEGGDGNTLRLTSSSSGTQRINVTSSTTLSINTWYHIAVTRTHSSGAWATYINGTVDSSASGTESSSVSTATWPFEIGRDQVATDRYWNGYIQDFRITKGLARYTTNFTPPTAELDG